MKQKLTRYSVDYAYMSSSWATKLGYGATGCWIVESYTIGNARPKLVCGFINKSDAERECQKLEKSCAKS